MFHLWLLRFALVSRTMCAISCGSIARIRSQEKEEKLKETLNGEGWGTHTHRTSMWCRRDNVNKQLDRCSDDDTAQAHDESVCLAHRMYRRCMQIFVAEIPRIEQKCKFLVHLVIHSNHTDRAYFMHAFVSARDHLVTRRWKRKEKWWVDVLLVSTECEWNEKYTYISAEHQNCKIARLFLLSFIFFSCHCCEADACVCVSRVCVWLLYSTNTNVRTVFQWPSGMNFCRSDLIDVALAI